MAAPIEHVGEVAEQRDFVGKLHASAEKPRQPQPRRARPPKPNGSEAAVKKSAGQPVIAATAAPP